MTWAGLAFGLALFVGGGVLYAAWSVDRARTKILRMLFEDYADGQAWTAGVDLARWIGGAFYVAVAALQEEGLVERREGPTTPAELNARQGRPRYYYILTTAGLIAARDKR